MFALHVIASLIIAAGGMTSGLYLACRYDWPRRVYARLFRERT